MTSVLLAFLLIPVVSGLGACINVVVKEGTPLLAAVSLPSRHTSLCIRQIFIKHYSWFSTSLVVPVK